MTRVVPSICKERGSVQYEHSLWVSTEGTVRIGGFTMRPAIARRFDPLAKKVGSGSEIYMQEFGGRVPACGTNCSRPVNGLLVSPGNMNQKYMNNR